MTENKNNTSKKINNVENRSMNEFSLEDRVHARGREGEGIKMQNKKTDNVLKDNNSKEAFGQVQGERSKTVDNQSRQVVSPNNYGPDDL